MGCPICEGSPLPDDVYVAEKLGKRVILQGCIRDIYNPKDNRCSPFSNYFTVSLSPKKGRVKHLKFRTQDELNKWGFSKGEKGKWIRCEGCLHKVNDKEIVFDITKVEFL